MRCLACNVPLNDSESTRRYAESGEFVDLCNKCHKWLPDDVNTVVNPEHEELIWDVDDELVDLEYVESDNDFKENE